MDFVNFAAVEFVGAIEAQRAFERGQRKWLRAWRQLERTGMPSTEIKPVVLRDPAGEPETSERRAA